MFSFLSCSSSLSQIASSLHTHMCLLANLALQKIAIADKLLHIEFFIFLRFSSHCFVFFNSLGNGEFHSDPVHTNPVQNFPAFAKSLRFHDAKVRNKLNGHNYVATGAGQKKSTKSTPIVLERFEPPVFACICLLALLHSFSHFLWAGRKVPTKSLFEQEAPKIGTQKCSTKRGVRESCV